MGLDFSFLLESAPFLLKGAGIALLVSGVAISLGIIFGLSLCFVVTSKNRVLSVLGRTYQSLFRGTPILVQLLVVYYSLPVLGIDAPPLIAAMAALTMNASAFQAEIYRGGFMAIPKGQIEAARVLGIGIWRTRVRILIPQMMRSVIPPLVNDSVSILKNSSLISVIAVVDLMRVSQQIAAVTFRPAEIYIVAGAMYLMMNLVLAWVGRISERHFGRHL